MPALCSMHRPQHYAQNHAGIMYLALGYIFCKLYNLMHFYSKRFQTWKKRLAADSVLWNLSQALIKRVFFKFYEINLPNVQSDKSWSSFKLLLFFYCRHALNITTTDDVGKNKNSLLRILFLWYFIYVTRQLCFHFCPAGTLSHLLLVLLMSHRTH